ncbi:MULTISPECIES: hypothetical protein [unclassified Corynebacterium]|uniref:hypothetical protein n=1 Tax=unclassified Corynebacterium TaxID=2624378 RepID=UPI0035240490
MSEHTNPEHRNITSTPDYLPELGATALPSGCTLYGTGHSVHWIRMNHAASGDWEPAVILGARENHLIFTHGDTKERRWNHDPERLRAIADLVMLEPDAEVLWSDRYSILKVTIGTKAWLLGLDEHDGSPCQKQ